MTGVRFFGILTIFFGSQSALAGLSFDLMHTRPECNHPGQASTWCTPADRANAAHRAGMEAEVTRMLDQARAPERASVTIAYFSFSNRAVFTKLCELGKKGIPLEGFFDSSENKAGSYALRLRTECQAQRGSNVKIHFLGTKEPWRLHHNKFLLVDSGQGDAVQIGFSSGNLSESGLSLHFDHWVVVRATRDTHFARQHFCVVEALRKAVGPQGSGKDDPKLYRSVLDRCLVQQSLFDPTHPGWIEKALQQERIAALFAPDPADRIAEALIFHINQVVPGGTIRGAIQHFLHEGIAQALRQAVNRGVRVTLLMDDDVVQGDGVPGARQFFLNWLTPSRSGIDLGLIQTNSGMHQMMHNKFLIFEGLGRAGIKRVFSGAGHFTKAATKNNYENFYFSQDANLTRQYEDLFEFMNERRVSIESVTGARH